MGTHKREIYAIAFGYKKTGYKKPWAVESARELPVFFLNIQHMREAGMLLV